MASAIFDSYVASLPSLAGKCVAITGTTSGTGYWCAVAAVMKNASCILLVNRPSERASSAMKAIGEFATATKLVAVDCDLTCFASVRAAAAMIEQAAAEYGGLSVLCNNAGIMAFPDVRTADGCEIQMQTNHTSHFLLTKLCMASLEKAAAAHGEARVVQHSSMARLFPMNLRAAYFKPSAPGSLGGDGLVLGANFVRYHMTKLANSVFGMALHAKLAARGSRVKSLVAEPGIAATQLTPTLLANTGRTGRLHQWISGLFHSYIMQSAADGATPLIGCCFGASSASGDFLVPRRMLWGAPTPTIAAGVPRFSALTSSESLTLSASNQRLLWEASEVAIGEEFDL